VFESKVQSPKSRHGSKAQEVSKSRVRMSEQVHESKVQSLKFKVTARVESPGDVKVSEQINSN